MKSAPSSIEIVRAMLAQKKQRLDEHKGAVDSKTKVKKKKRALKNSDLLKLALRARERAEDGRRIVSVVCG